MNQKKEVAEEEEEDRGGWIHCLLFPLLPPLNEEDGGRKSHFSSFVKTHKKIT